VCSSIDVYRINCVYIYTYLTHLILLNLISETVYVKVGFEVLTAVVMKSSVFWDIILTLVSCLAYSLSLKMEATCSPETSVDFQRTTRRYSPEDGTLQIKYGFSMKRLIMDPCHAILERR
jgi:hypothetical protein